MRPGSQPKKLFLDLISTALAKIIWGEVKKCAALLLILKKRIQMGTSTRLGIPYKEFESVTAKIHHAFTPVLARARLLSPCNKILVTKPTRVGIRDTQISMLLGVTQKRNVHSTF
jgi:hypothetical protein